MGIRPSKKKLLIIIITLIFLAAGVASYFLFFKETEKIVDSADQSRPSVLVLETATLDELSELPAEERIGRTIALAITKLHQGDVEGAKLIFTKVYSDTEIGDQNLIVAAWLRDIAVSEKDQRGVEYWGKEIETIENAIGQGTTLNSWEDHP